MRVEVTEGLIESGEARHCEHCPIAEAVRVACVGTFGVVPYSVHVRQRVRIMWPDGSVERFPLSVAMGRFIATVDGDDLRGLAGAVRVRSGGRGAGGGGRLSLSPLQRYIGAADVMARTIENGAAIQ